jgi:hypothetical protein
MLVPLPAISAGFPSHFGLSQAIFQLKFVCVTGISMTDVLQAKISKHFPWTPNLELS